MGYCKHQWEDRSEILRHVFAADPSRRDHDFYVCARCLKIDETQAGERSRIGAKTSGTTAA